MDWLQFVSSVIGSLAWPVAAVAAIIIFQKKIAELMPRLKLKYKDFEASFRLDQAEKEAASLPPTPSTPEAQPTPEEKAKFESLAEVSPRAAILEARLEIEDAVRDLARVSGLASDRIQSVLGLTRLLRSREVIDHQTAALLDDLRVVGNQAAHDSRTNFETVDALRYKVLTDRLLSQLRATSNFIVNSKLSPNSNTDTPRMP